MPPAEDIERQIAVTVVITVEEPTLLMAMQRIVSGIEVENDPLERRLVRLEEESDEQALDRRRVMADPVVAARNQGRVLEPVERAFAGERRAILALRGELAGQGREHRIVAQLVVIDQVLVAERDPNTRCATIAATVCSTWAWSDVVEAGREPGHQANRPISRAEQQRPGIRRDRAAIESRHHLAAFDHFITEQVAATLCRHRGAPPIGSKSFRQNDFVNSEPDAPTSCEKYGLRLLGIRGGVHPLGG